MSDFRTRVNPRKDPGGNDPDATHWTAKDARESFGPGPSNQSGTVPPAQNQGAQSPAAQSSVGQNQAAVSGASVAGVQSAPSGPVQAPAGRTAAAGLRRTRKARLRISRIDPWSVMKTSLLFGVAGAIIFFIAVWVVWGVIGASGAFDSMNKAVNDLIASPTSQEQFQLSDYLNTGRVLGLTAIIGAIDAVLFTALATLFSFLYNLAAQVMGGLEVTLAED